MDKLKGLVTTLEADGIEAGAFEADVRNYKQLTLALDTVNQRYGSIDVLEYSPTPPQNSMRGPPPPGFPPSVPLVAAQEVADLIWNLHVRRDRVEAYAGDIDALLANSLLY